MNGVENERTAANIQASISSQLFGASLVLIGILIGVLDIKEIDPFSLKGILLDFSIIFLLTSFFSAGYGQKKIRNNGLHGNWSLEGLHIFFRLQTMFNVLAILLFFISMIIPNPETQQVKFQKSLIEIEKSKLKYDSLIILQNAANFELIKDRIQKSDSPTK